MVNRDNVKRSKRKSLIKKSRVTRLELTMFRGKKPTHIFRLQRPLKSLPQPKAELVDLRKNPNKIILYQNKDPHFFQISFYKNNPHQFMIVSKNDYITCGAEYAFILLEALKGYIEILKKVGVGKPTKRISKKKLELLLKTHFSNLQ